MSDATVTMQVVVFASEKSRTVLERSDWQRFSTLTAKCCVGDDEEADSRGCDR